MKMKMIIGVVILLIVVVLLIFVFVEKGKAPSSVPSVGSGNATSQSLGAQIYNNVAPQNAVPQSLPQTNPFQVETNPFNQ